MSQSNQCIECKNYEGVGTCKAFPLKIPVEIITGEFIHDTKHPQQDNNIIFQDINE